MKELIVSPIYNEKGNIVGQEYHGELVRCKDCKWYYIGGAICARYEYFHDDAIVPADGYCFRAERKDNETN